MFCTNCGSHLDDNAVACPQCGVATDNFYAPRGATHEADDAPSMGFAVLSFFFPIVGLILYLVWHGTMPQRARSCGKGALIGFVVDVLLVIFLILMYIYLFSYIFKFICYIIYIFFCSALA